MRFCPWYALETSGDHAPAEPGVLQLRLANGLLDYPRGKSAMVWYGASPDVCATALELARAHERSPLGPLVCRHLIEIQERDPDFAAFCAKLRDEFVRRFGTVPVLEQ
ncbi:hypothetical protein BH11MYX2_BH11MYX2_19680 [soil metagenome]